VAQADLSDTFVDAAAGNLRLKSTVPGTCGRLESAPADIDSQQRPEHPVAGAHEFPPPAQSPKPDTSRADETANAAPPEPAWVDAMRKVHGRFRGTAGYVAQFGDSITYSMAFWSPLGWDYPDKYLQRDDVWPKTPRDARWRT